MIKANEYRAYFTLVGEFDPRDITERLGFQPTRSWKKGDLNPATHFERKYSRWCVDSRLDQSVSLEEQVSDVIKQLQPHREAVSGLQLEFEPEMQLVGHFYAGYPGFGLDATLVTALAELKLSIDCDFYYLYSDKREDS